MRWLCLILICVLTGCLRRGNQARTAWEPGSLYLRGEGPIYVELDVNSGCDPDARSLASLRSFLERHTGREVVLGDPETLHDGFLPMTEQAAKHWQGPPEPGDDFLYVLFFDSDEQAGVLPGYSIMAHVGEDFPGAIYVNKSGLDDASWIPWDDWRDSLPLTLAHEAGHVLGLVLDDEGYESHGDGAHCTTPGCLMGAGPTGSWWAALFRVEAGVRELCGACSADLARRRKLPRSRSFKGGFLTRVEEGYWVASAPGTTVLGLTPYAEVDWRKLREEAQDGHQRKFGKWRYTGLGRFRAAIDIDLSSPERWPDLLKRVKQAASDRNPAVKGVVPELQRQLEALCARRRLIDWR